jgi:hypothetical protein
MLQGITNNGDKSFAVVSGGRNDKAGQVGFGLATVSALSGLRPVACGLCTISCDTVSR